MFVTATVTLPLKLVAGEQIELGVVLVDNTGMTLTSATEAVVKLVQPVTELVTKTVYERGADPTGLLGPPTLIAVTEVPLLAASNSLPTTTAPPVYHCCVNGPGSSATLVTV